MDCRRVILAVFVGLPMITVVPASGRWTARDDDVAVQEANKRAFAISVALDEARNAATRIRDPLRATEAMARVADLAWEYDSEGSRKAFERAFDVLAVELRAGGVRAAVARPYMEYLLALYARHAWERAADLAIDYAASYAPASSDDRYRVAQLLANIALDDAAASPARRADLARRSAATGVATVELAELLAEIDSPDRYRLILGTVRLAATQQDGLVVLLALNDRLHIVEFDDHVRLGDRSTMELAAEWLRSIRRALARASRYAAEQAASGSALSAYDVDAVHRVLDQGNALLDAFHTWRTENTDRAAELLYSLSTSVAFIEDTAATRSAVALAVRPPTAAELLHLADRAPTVAVADALRQRAALMIAHDRATSRREQAVRAALADIRNVPRRDATADLTYLVYAEEALSDRRAHEAASYIGRVADVALRTEAAGYAALAVAATDVDAAEDLANLARSAAASARPSSRVVGGLLAAARAVRRIDGTARALEFLRDAFAVFDKLDYAAESQPVGPGSDAYFVTFGTVRVSPFVAVGVRDLPLRETMTTLLADDEGIRLAAQGVRSPDARLDTFLALAMVYEDAAHASEAGSGTP